MDLSRSPGREDPPPRIHLPNRPESFPGKAGIPIPSPLAGGYFGAEPVDPARRRSHGLRPVVSQRPGPEGSCQESAGVHPGIDFTRRFLEPREGGGVTQGCGASDPDFKPLQASPKILAAWFQ